MIRCSLHNHTYYCDGKNTPEEMLLAALEHAGATSGEGGGEPITKADLYRRGLSGREGSARRRKELYG